MEVASATYPNGHANRQAFAYANRDGYAYQNTNPVDGYLPGRRRETKIELAMNKIVDFPIREGRSQPADHVQTLAESEAIAFVEEHLPPGAFSGKDRAHAKMYVEAGFKRCAKLMVEFCRQYLDAG